VRSIVLLSASPVAFLDDEDSCLPAPFVHIAQEAAASFQKAAKTTKPHGLPKCDGTFDESYFHFQWGDEIWGDFFYEPNKRVWIEEAPQCESWSPEAVEMEWGEYEQKVREGRNPHRPKRQRARPKEELCFAPTREGTPTSGGVDVESRVSWHPAFLFNGFGDPREKVCGELDGHLTPNPEPFRESGLKQVAANGENLHLYYFYEDKDLRCSWPHPGAKSK